LGPCDPSPFKTRVGNPIKKPRENKCEEGVLVTSVADPKYFFHLGSRIQQKRREKITFLQSSSSLT
jgi:hypothetical protein